MATLIIGGKTAYYGHFQIDEFDRKYTSNHFRNGYAEIVVSDLFVKYCEKMHSV